jgi:hypothetical protein
MTRTALIIFFCLGASSASAALITYTDRGTFNASAPAVVVEGFEAAAANDNTFTTFSGPLDAASSNAVFAPGDVLPGFQIVDNPGPDANGLIALGAGLNTPTKAILANTFTDGMDVLFSAGTQAVGFDFWTAPSPGANSAWIVTISVFDLNDVLLGSFVPSSSTSAGVFFGVTSDAEAIGRVNIFSAGNQAEAIDDLAFDAVSGVPEPGSLLLLSSGAALFILLRRRG